MKRCQWVKPVVNLQVEFTEWTLDNQLRQPVFLGLRTDGRRKMSSANRSVRRAKVSSLCRLLPTLAVSVKSRYRVTLLVGMELAKAKTAREVSEVLLKYGVVQKSDRNRGSGLSICGTSITEPENQEDT